MTPETGIPVTVGVVAGHGAYAEGMVSAVEQITGRGAAFVTVSNTGLSPSQLETRIGEALDRTGAQVIFTDLPAGSCTMTVRRLQRARPGIVLVTGANVAMLLEFLFAAEASSATATDQSPGVAALVRTAADKARGTLAVYGG